MRNEKPNIAYLILEQQYHEYKRLEKDALQQLQELNERLADIRKALKDIKEVGLIFD